MEDAAAQRNAPAAGPDCATERVIGDQRSSHTSLSAMYAPDSPNEPVPPSPRACGEPPAARRAWKRAGTLRQYRPVERASVRWRTQRPAGMRRRAHDPRSHRLAEIAFQARDRRHRRQCVRLRPVVRTPSRVARTHGSDLPAPRYPRTGATARVHPPQQIGVRGGGWRGHVFLPVCAGAHGFRRGPRVGSANQSFLAPSEAAHRPRGIIGALRRRTGAPVVRSAAPPTSTGNAEFRTAARNTAPSPCPTPGKNHHEIFDRICRCAVRAGLERV